jgi:hypothetical protein
MVSIDGGREVLVGGGSVTRRWVASSHDLWDGLTAAGEPQTESTVELARWSGDVGGFIGLPGGAREVPVAIAEDPPTHRLALGFADGRIEIVDDRDGSTLSSLPRASAEPPTAFAFDAAGMRLLVVSPRAGLTAFDLATGERLLVPESIGTVALAFRPDGRRVITATRSSLQVRDATSLEVVNAIEFDFGAEIPNGIGFSTDGTIAAVGGTGQLFDAETGTPIGDSFPHGPTMDSIGVVRSTAAVASSAPTLVALTNGGVVVWSLDPDDWIQTGCELVGRNLTSAERIAFGLDPAVVDVCGTDVPES